MLKKEFLPLAIFLLLVLWVTVSFGAPFLEKDDASGSVADSESKVSSISTMPTVTDTPTQSPSSTPTFTPSPTNTAMPTLTPSPTATSIPSPSSPGNTPAPKPTQNPLAGTIIKNTTLRTDGNENSSIVGIAYIGEVFNILEGDPDNREWIKINIADEKIGWARTKNVETMEVINSVTPSAPPTPDTVPALLISGDDNYMAERSFIDRLESGQQRWYTFEMAEQITDINITLLVKPTTNKVSLAVYTERQYELYKYEDLNSPSVEEIGRVDTSIEKDWLHWIGNIAPDSRYFFRIVNNDEQVIEYCLAPRGSESWDKCP